MAKAPEPKFRLRYLLRPSTTIGGQFQDGHVSEKRIIPRQMRSRNLEFTLENTDGMRGMVSGLIEVETDCPILSDQHISLEA